MSERGQDFVRRLSLVFIQPPKVNECERPSGPVRTLDDWRAKLVRSRQDILGRPGLYLDRSETGAGKSTADIEAVRKVGRALIVTPCHENGAEIEEEMLAKGIDAMKYPARATSGEHQNCENILADRAEAMALSVIPAVCWTCQFRANCLVSGYLGELHAVDAASVAIATHARAVFNGFDKLAAGRGEFIAVHEDAADTVCPNTAVTDADLQQSADVVASLLSDPMWLNWFGQNESRDEDGGLTLNEKLAERRNQLYEFVGRLAELIDRLRAQLNTAERTSSVTMPSPVSKAVGIERLLFRATLEANIHFKNSPWRLLLAAITGELFSLGVIVDERPDA